LRKTPFFLLILDVLTVLLLCFDLVMILFFTPVEAVMGPVQKIFYFHVAASWAGMLSFIIAAVGGGLFLFTRRFKWDWLSLSAVEIGLVFGLITLTSGMIWAQPIWNTWWVWDPRLTTTTIMELIFAAYFILRNSLDSAEKRARLGAVYALLGVVTVPLTFFSIRLFRTIHPVVIAVGSSGGAGFSMSPRMLRAFFSSLVTFTVLLAALLWHRFRLARAQWQRSAKEG
jgi:heme exporter protein C